jgi:hypothetical protein
VTIENAIPLVITAIVVIAAISKQLRGLGRGYGALVEKQRYEALRAAEAAVQSAQAGVSAGGPSTAGATRADVAAVLKAAVAAYEAAPAYTAAVSAPAPAYQPAHTQHRAAAVKRAAPAVRSVDVPAAVARVERWTIADAFRDPTNARMAIVMAEILGPPRALR